MNYIKTTFLCAALAISPFVAGAQEADKADSLGNGGENRVNVAYRTVAEQDLLGGTSVLDMEALTEKNYTTGFNDLEAYVGGWNGNSLWGMDGDNEGYLVLIDGIPRDANNVVPTEIAQVTFLKGAAASVLYGSRGAKGAILITTKRGKVNGLQVSLRANTGFNVMKSLPEYLGSAEYMTYYNQARKNDGLDPLYSAEDIYHHSTGSNPFRYPNINYYSDEYIKESFNRTDVTAEIEGGGQRAHFYSNVGYYHQGDYLNFGEGKHNGVSRLNVRGNVDVDINRFMKAFINANATFYDSKSAKGDFWNTASTARPNRPEYAAPLIPVDLIDPNADAALDLISGAKLYNGNYFLGGTAIDVTNAIADGYAAGKTKYTSRQFQFDAGLDVDLSGITQGLKFRTQFAVDYATTYNTSYDDKYAVYTPTWSNYNGKDVIVALKKEGNDEHNGVQNISNSTDRQTIAFSGQFNYDRTFNDAHNVSAMLVVAGHQRTFSGQYHRNSNAHISLLADYNYRQKYYVEFAAAAIHSAKLAEGNREAISPSLTLGWRLSKENFLAKSKAVDDLFLSVSATSLKQDLDINGYYLYDAVWDQTTYGYGWYDGTSLQYTKSKRGENENLDFITRKEISVNLRGSFFDRMLTADVSFFTNRCEGYLVSSSTTFPNHLVTGYPEASFIPTLNFNNNSRYGFDFSVNFRKRFGQVDLGLGVNGTYYKTKATRRDETHEYDYQYREGRMIDGIWGYQSAGLFQSQEEIDAAPKQNLGSDVKPGDIRYIDQNNDNVIDTKDQVLLARGGWYGAPFTMGVNLTVKWKNLTFFAMGIGRFGGHGLKNSAYYWVNGDDKYSAIVRDTWTEENPNAAFPRLSTGSSSNNYCDSDFWLYKNDRFDLAKVQITYDLPSRLLRKCFIKGLSVYVSGSNLLTISKERKHLEMTVAGTPQARFYNVGVKATF